MTPRFTDVHVTASRRAEEALHDLHQGGHAEGARRSTLEELTDWTLWADEALTF